MAVGIDGVTPFECYLCVAAGLWGGCLIGFITEYYTSHTYLPVREVARSTETGAATNIIYGLALGYQSCILPVIIISLIIFLSLRSDIHPHPIHQSLHAPFHPCIYQFINQSTIQLPRNLSFYPCIHPSVHSTIPQPPPCPTLPKPQILDLRP